MLSVAETLFCLQLVLQRRVSNSIEWSVVSSLKDGPRLPVILKKLGIGTAVVEKGLGRKCHSPRDSLGITEDLVYSSENF